ncbi:MAG: orotidine-5'-phosphate decarboxylase [Campylobacteraceae bacterium]|jgi:orotidine-5'-phosphate decarboxylase|nr:orotidine-5'-phosphate decarboxylase [Campylobacteraceae bacterium]
MKLCVALDLPHEKDNISLAKSLKECDVWLKVGLRSFIRDGKNIVSELKNINDKFKIFLDLKLYDIPNTMADAAESIAKLNVEMFNVHASSGKIAMKAVMERLKPLKNPPIVLSVTALTSFDDDEFKSVYNENIAKKTLQFAKDSFESRLDGVVCSVHESLMIKSYTKSDFITLTPGIRPFGDEQKDDQKRVANIQIAHENKCDFIVVGRPIYQAKNPFDAVQKILEGINGLH